MKAKSLAYIALISMVGFLGCSSNENLVETDIKNSVLRKIEMVDVEGANFPFNYIKISSDKFDVNVRSFRMSKHEVTRELWAEVMDEPKDTYCPTCPRDNIDLTSLPLFFSKLNQLTGKKYRLPTVAEWEFAYKGGKKSQGYNYSGSNNANDVAWYSENCTSIQPVGLKTPNELGIYDMDGNVLEMCSDYIISENFNYLPQPSNHTGPINGRYKMYRGSYYASWILQAGNGTYYLHSGGGLAGYDPNGNSFSGIGFRLVETIGDEPSIVLGQDYQGGIVVYIDETGQHGLILSKEPALSFYEFGCLEAYPYPNSESGLINTQHIANACKGKNTAAEYCYNLVLNGYSDWFLPSISELKKIRENWGYDVNQTYIGGMSSTAYYYYQGLNPVDLPVSSETGILNSGFRPVRAF